MKWIKSALLLALRPLSPGRDATADLLRLTLVALPVDGFLLFTSNYTFPGGAWQFTSWARTLASGGILPQDAAQRDVGFPLALLLSGYPQTGSFIGITLLHWAMGLAMPLLVYGTVGGGHRVAAFYAGLAMIGSLIPIVFVKFIHHDQTYLFLTVLVVYLLAKYARSGRWTDLSLFTAASIAASLTRPAGNLLFPSLLLAAVHFWPRRPRRYLVNLALFICVLAAYQHYRLHVFAVADGQPMPSYTGKQIFYNLYINSREFNVRLAPDFGPATRTLADSVEKWLGENPVGSRGFTAWAVGQGLPEAYFVQQFGAFAGLDAHGMTERMFSATNWDYFQLMCDAETSDRPFLAASLEIVKVRPLYPVRFIARNLMFFLFSPGHAHTRFNTNPLSREGINFLPAAETAGVGNAVDVPAAGIRELDYQPMADAPRIVRRVFTVIERAWERSYRAFVGVTASLMVLAGVGVGVRMAMPGGGRQGSAAAALAMPHSLMPATVGSVVLLLYSAAVTCALAEPSFRYHFFIIPQQTVAAACGAVVMGQIIRAGYLGSLARDSLERWFRWGRRGRAREAVIRNKQFAITIISLLVLLICISWGGFEWLHTHIVVGAGRS